MIHPTRVISVAAMVMVGCNPSSTPVAKPTVSKTPDPVETSVVLYVPGMNQELQIL